MWKRPNVRKLAVVLLLLCCTPQLALADSAGEPGRDSGQVNPLIRLRFFGG